MEPKVKKILVLRDEEIPNLSTVVKMAYCELLPYSQQSGFTKYPEYPSRIWGENVPNGNAAWLNLNKCRVAFVGHIETFEPYWYQLRSVGREIECDYFICCIDNRRDDYLLDRLSGYFNASIEWINFSRNKEEQPAEEFKEDIPTDKLEVCEFYSRKIVDKLKSLCGIIGKPSIETEGLNKLAVSANSYVKNYRALKKDTPKFTKEDAIYFYSSFNVEWGKVIYFNTDSDNYNVVLKSSYGDALTIFAQSAEVLSISVESVEWLTALVYCYEINTGSNGIYSTTKELYISLSVCWHKLGENFDVNAIYTLRRYLLNLFKNEAEQPDATDSVYGFRKVSTYFLEALIGHTLNITSPFEFNDPFDTPILELYEGRHLGELIKEAFKGTLKVACFSTSTFLAKLCLGGIKAFLSPLMWAHYADNHKGVCIKYRFNAKEFCKENTHTVAVGFKDVTYSSKALKACGCTSSISMDDAFFLKGTDWEYENERRLFCFDINGKGSFGHYGDTAGCIEAVYFGLRCSNEDKKAIIQILRCNHSTTSGTEKEGTVASSSSIQFHQMTINHQEFGMLEPKELSTEEIDELLRE